ncbi:SMP-30/gluconolactonase/LRE family protein [Poritiphilus flavus]|uniref:Uncharacterized protein n=1 Tax=Poritiphilus flavus TaxID=2697053 RepID=A0A6L9E8Z5_9FLAO|nr:hypothetical protein [Poritiphilus flavus]NAS11247.1 hypothetical protein [Poritiphilus flavus]
MRGRNLNVGKSCLGAITLSIYSCCCLIFITACGSKSSKNSQSDSGTSMPDHYNILPNQGLERPESIVYDELKDVFYVSNGKDYAPGDQGFISKISGSGELISLKWVSGLNRPTGMAIHKDQLYVADVNSLKIIDTETAEVIDQLQEPLPNSGINDVSISPQGEVYLSASAVHAVFKVSQDQLEVWLTDAELLKWANGISAGEQSLLVGGFHLTTIDKTSREITQLETRPAIEDIDGLWPDGKGGYFISTVGSSALWQMDASLQAIELLSSDSLYFGDLEYVPSKSAIYVPRGNSESNSYCISVVKIQ